MDPAIGWAAGSPPECCSGYAASPSLQLAAVALALPRADAAAPLPSLEGLESDIRNTKKKNLPLIGTTKTVHYTQAYLINTDNAMEFEN